MPFGQLESALQGKTTTSIQKTKQNEESVVRKLMLDMWNQVTLILICATRTSHYQIQIIVTIRY